MQRRVLVASLGLQCGLPSWINRPVRIGWCLLASVGAKSRKRSKPNVINDEFDAAARPSCVIGALTSAETENRK